jgi:hypothetical protein
LEAAKKVARLNLFAGRNLEKKIKKKTLRAKNFPGIQKKPTTWMVLTRTQSTQSAASGPDDPAEPEKKLPPAPLRRTRSSSQQNVLAAASGVGAGDGGAPLPPFLRPPSAGARRRSGGSRTPIKMEQLLVSADTLLRHLNALWALRALGAPERGEIGAFLEHYGLTGAVAADMLEHTPGIATVDDLESLVTDERNSFDGFASAVHAEAIRFARACNADVRSAAHAKTKRRIEKLVAAVSASEEARDDKENFEVQTAPPPAPVIVKQGYVPFPPLLLHVKGVGIMFLLLTRNGFDVTGPTTRLRLRHR